MASVFSRRYCPSNCSDEGVPMSINECTACHAPLTGQGRFCGSCGAPVGQAQVVVDPLGRAASSPAPGVPATNTSGSVTLNALGIPQSSRQPKDRTSAVPRDMDWLEGAVVALIAFVPAILVGIGLSVTQGGVGLSLPGWVGIAASLTYGGSVGLNAEVNAVLASAQGSLFVTSYSLTIVLISGLLLFAGTRRVLRRADVSDLGSCLRRVTPVTVVFVLGAVILSALARGASLPVDGVALVVSPPLMRVFFMSALLAALAVGVAVVSKARFANPSLGQAWRTLSAPVFAVVLLVFLVGALAVLGGSTGFVVASGWDWGGLALIPGGGLAFIEVALIMIALGTLSGLGITADSGALTLFEEITGDRVTLPTSGGFGIWTIFGEVAWLGVVILVVVNAAGVIAAGAMILRRRDASVARRDLGVWVASFFVLGLVMVIFVGFGVDVAAEVASALGSLSESGTVSAGISASVLLLLPAFAAAWWFLARIILPRLPASTLMRLSDWARWGL